MDTSATPPVTTVAAQPNSEQVVLTALQHHESWQALGRCSLLQLWPFTYNGLIQGEVSLDTWLRSALFRAQQFIAEGVEGVVEGDRWNIVQYMASNIDRSFFAHLRIPAKQSTGPSPRQHKLLSHTIQFMGMTENPDGLERNLRSYRDAMDDATSRLIGALLIRLMLLDKLSAALLRPSDTVTEHPPQPLRPLGLWGTKHQFVEKLKNWPDILRGAVVRHESFQRRAVNTSPFQSTTIADARERLHLLLRRSNNSHERLGESHARSNFSDYCLGIGIQSHPDFVAFYEEKKIQAFFGVCDGAPNPPGLETERDWESFCKRIKYTVEVATSCSPLYLLLPIRAGVQPDPKQSGQKMGTLNTALIAYALGTQDKPEELARIEAVIFNEALNSASGMDEDECFQRIVDECRLISASIDTKSEPPLAWFDRLYTPATMNHPTSGAILRPATPPPVYQDAIGFPPFNSLNFDAGIDGMDFEPEHEPDDGRAASSPLTDPMENEESDVDMQPPDAERNKRGLDEIETAEENGSTVKRPKRTGDEDIEDAAYEGADEGDGGDDLQPRRSARNRDLAAKAPSGNHIIAASAEASETDDSSFNPSKQKKGTRKAAGAAMSSGPKSDSQPGTSQVHTAADPIEDLAVPAVSKPPGPAKDAKKKDPNWISDDSDEVWELTKAQFEKIRQVEVPAPRQASIQPTRGGSLIAKIPVDLYAYDPRMKKVRQLPVNVGKYSLATAKALWDNVTSITRTSGDGGIPLYFSGKKEDLDKSCVFVADSKTPTAQLHQELSRRNVLWLEPSTSTSVRKHFSLRTLAALGDLDKLVQAQDNTLRVFGEKVPQEIKSRQISKHADKGKFSMHVPITLRDMVNAQGNDRLMNCLTLTLDDDRLVRNTISRISDVSSCVYSTRVMAETDEFVYPLPPTEEMNWAIATHSGCFHLPHIDTGGALTTACMLAGTKVWVLFTPKDKRLSSINFFPNTWDPNDIDVSLYDAEVVLLQAGDTLMLTPGQIHAVFTIEDSAMVGNHFFLSDAAERTVPAFLHTFLVSKLITNAEHHTMFIYRERMFQFYLADFKRQARSSDTSMLTPHSLRFDTPEGLLNFLLWALLVVFADSLDFYKYARHVEIPRVYEDRLLRSRLRKEFKYVMMEELPRYYAVTLHQTACNLWTDVIAEMVMNFSRAIISFHDLKFSKRDGKTPATAKLREAYLTREMLRNRLEKDVRRLDRGWVAAALAVPNSPDSRKAVFFYDWPIKVSRKDGANADVAMG